MTLNKIEVFALCLVIALALIASGLYNKESYSASNEKLKLKAKELEELQDVFTEWKKHSYTHDEMINTWSQAYELAYTNAVIDCFLQKSYILVQQKDGKIVVWRQQMSYTDTTEPVETPKVEIPTQHKKK